MTARRGSLFVELAAAASALLLAGGLVAGVAWMRRQAARDEWRAAELDQAQNLLDAVRAGDAAMPAGWRLESAVAASGAEAVTVTGPLGTRLTTLRRRP